MLVLRRSPRVISVRALEGFCGLDVSAQHVRTAIALRQPPESFLSSAGAGDDDCDQDNNKDHSSDDTADDWGERELAPIIWVTLY